MKNNLVYSIDKENFNHRSISDAIEMEINIKKTGVSSYRILKNE